MIDRQPRYSVVVPVFESSHSVVELVARLQSVFDDEIKSSHEIILVDDGSRSTDTWPALESLALSNAHITAIRLTRNFGKPGAVLCGISHAKGEWVITIDDDLQQAPEDIPKLISHQDHDVVVASFIDKKHDVVTRLTSQIKGYIESFSLGLPCRMSPLKLFKAHVAKAMLEIRSPHPFIPALMAHVTDDFVSVRVEHARSSNGRSRFTTGRRFKQFLNLLIGDSSLLLRCFGIIGSITALAGFVYAGLILIWRLFGTIGVSGWTSLIIINLIYGGLILVALGIIGEYLIRLLEGSSRKPPFITRDIVTKTSDLDVVE